MRNLPIARTANIVVQALGDELLIYNLLTHKACNLNETSTIVYQACGQGLTFEELKRKHKFTNDLICFALDELQANDLLEKDSVYKSSLNGLSRREVIRRIGLSTVIALPIITGLIAPKAVQAASGCPSPFSSGNIPSNCPVGGRVTGLNSTCGNVSDASRSSICNTVYSGLCASGTAAYAGDCVNVGPNSNYSCVCS